MCRRAEIEVLRLAESQNITDQVLAYLNRLSDFLFVVARAANDNGNYDILWIPGEHTN